MFSASWCLLLWRVQKALAVRKQIGVEKTNCVFIIIVPFRSNKKGHTSAFTQ